MVHRSPLRTGLAAVGLVVALMTAWTGSALDAAAQEETPAPPAEAESAEQAAPARAELENRLAALNAELEAIKAQVKAAEDRRAAANATETSALADIDSVIDERARTVVAKDGPRLAKREIAITAYMGGNPRGRSLLEAIRTGEFEMDSHRSEVLFASAEEYVEGRLVQLDVDIAALDVKRNELDAAVVQAKADAEAAGADITTLDVEVSRVDKGIADVELAIIRYDEAARVGYPLTGIPGTIDRPALAVKIDNHPRARPQSGLGWADLVIEELVEGGLTRYVAVFQSADAEVVGPIRSGRTSDFLVLANLNNALFAASGGNKGVLDALSVTNLVPVLQNYAADAYYRGPGFAPHNLFSSTKALYDANPGEAGQPPRLFRYRLTGDVVAGRVVNSVGVSVGDERVSYTWTGQIWHRSQDGVALSDADGLPLGGENIIIQFVEYGASEADSRSPEVVITGTGPVWVLTAGQLVEGTWSRPTVNETMLLTDTAGVEIKLTPGRTWLLLPKRGAASAS